MARHSEALGSELKSIIFFLALGKIKQTLLLFSLLRACQEVQLSTPIADEIYYHGFYIIDNFLTSTVFQQLRQTAELMHSQGHFNQAKIGRKLAATHNANIRSDKICWLEKNSKNSALAVYFAKIEEIAKALNESLFLGLADFESHFAIYKPGAFYKKHVDQFNHTKDRRISCVYYLNANWNESLGGQLKLYDGEDKLLTTVFPQSNRFICFNSDLPHEVCATQEIRYSIAGWMKTRSMEFI